MSIVSSLFYEVEFRAARRTVLSLRSPALAAQAAVAQAGAPASMATGEAVSVPRLPPLGESVHPFCFVNASNRVTASVNSAVASP